MIRWMRFLTHASTWKVLTVGGGLGRVAFFDMRASKYIDIAKNSVNSSRSETWYVPFGPHTVRMHSCTFMWMSAL